MCGNKAQAGINPKTGEPWRTCEACRPLRAAKPPKQAIETPTNVVDLFKKRLQKKEVSTSTHGEEST
jgi:hypothetical protein